MSASAEVEVAWGGSYLLGNDTVRGWGTRYFFTFYSEFGQRGAAPGLEVAVLSVVFVLSIVSNVGIAVAVLKYRELRTVTNCFLLNLAVADGLFAMGIPAIAFTRMNPQWCLGGLVCRLLPYSQFVCGFVLLWTLTLISMDRHRCIVVPPYRSYLTPRLAALLTVATWALAAVLFLPVAFWFHEDTSLQICTLVFPRTQTVNVSICFTVTAIFFTCLLPMGLLVFHYQRIFHKLLKTRSRWATTTNLTQSAEEERTKKLSLQQIVYPARHPSLTHHEEMRLNKHVRVVRVLLLNVLVVLIMWLPITIVMFLIYIDGSRSTENTEFFLRSHHLIWALLIAYLNTLVNPVLYGLMSENFRACLSRMWFGSRRRKWDPPLTQEGSRPNRTLSCARNQQESVQHVKDKKPTLCYNLSWSDNRNSGKKSIQCQRHCHSYPGSAVSIADVPSTAAILKL